MTLIDSNLSSIQYAVRYPFCNQEHPFIYGKQIDLRNEEIRIDILSLIGKISFEDVSEDQKLILKQYCRLQHANLPTWFSSIRLVGSIWQDAIHYQQVQTNGWLCFKNAKIAPFVSHNDRWKNSVTLSYCGRFSFTVEYKCEDCIAQTINIFTCVINPSERTKICSYTNSSLSYDRITKLDIILITSRESEICDMNVASYLSRLLPYTFCPKECPILDAYDIHDMTSNLFAENRGIGKCGFTRIEVPDSRPGAIDHTDSYVLNFVLGRRRIYSILLLGNIRYCSLEDLSTHCKSIKENSFSDIAWALIPIDSKGSQESHSWYVNLLTEAVTILNPVNIMACSMACSSDIQSCSQNFVDDVVTLFFDELKKKERCPSLYYNIGF